jgi:hypothetical protein
MRLQSALQFEDRRGVEAGHLPAEARRCYRQANAIGHDMLRADRQRRAGAAIVNGR